jgi:hypothetical protein
MSSESNQQIKREEVRGRDSVSAEYGRNVNSDDSKAEMSPNIQKAYHNFTGTPIEQWRLTALATGPGALSADDVKGKPVGVKYYYTHRVTVESQRDGELIDVWRVVLIDADNTVVSCVSDYVAQGLQQMISAMGVGPYDPPLVVNLLTTKTKRGRNMLSLVPASE